MMKNMDFNLANYQLLFLLFLIAFSCDTKGELNTKNRKDEFPHLIDKLKLQYKLNSSKWNNSNIHNALYFGKEKDTILVDHFMNFYETRTKNDTINGIILYKQKSYKEYVFDENLKLNYKQVDSADINIRIDTIQIISNNDFEKSYPVIIKNVSNFTLIIGHGEHIPFITEAKDKEGEWKPLQYQYLHRCGNNLKRLILPPNEIVLTSEVVYSGKFETKLRLRMGKNLSEEFNGFINETQILNLKEHSPY